MTTQDELQIKLNRLVVAIPRLHRENPDSEDFVAAFAGEADVILDSAPPELFDWVATSLEGMLGIHGASVP